MAQIDRSKTSSSIVTYDISDAFTIHIELLIKFEFFF